MDRLSIQDVRESKKIPVEVKDLIVSLLQRLHTLENGIAGAIELAYRRGKQAGEEKGEIIL